MTRPQEATEPVVPSTRPRSAAGVRWLTIALSSGMHRVAPVMARKIEATIAGILVAKAAASSPRAKPLTAMRSSCNSPRVATNQPISPPCTTTMMAPCIPNTMPTWRAPQPSMSPAHSGNR